MNNKNKRLIQVKKPEFRWTIDPKKHMLYLDVGAWQGNEEGILKTNFILITGYAVALCSYFPLSKTARKNWKLGEQGFGQHSIEYASKHIINFLDEIVPFGNPLDHIQYFYRSKESGTPFWDENSLLIVIGDLHLHCYRQHDALNSEEVLVDNFIKKEKNTRKSLESDFCNFLNTIVIFKDKYPDLNIKIVQAGDILEIWELEQIIDKLVGSAKMLHINAEEGMADEYVLSHMSLQERDARARARNPIVFAEAQKYDEILDWFVKREIISRVPPPHRYTRDVIAKSFMYVMQTEIFTKIFDSIQYLHTWSIPFITTIGNHDSALKELIQKNKRHPLDRLEYIVEFNEGSDLIVHIEHGHRFDSFNKPGGDWFGRWVTGVNVTFENMGWGDFLKKLEEPIKEKFYEIKLLLHKIKVIPNLPLNERNSYIKASIDVDTWFKTNQNKNVSIFIMAHTHIPYARKIPRNIDYRKWLEKNITE